MHSGIADEARIRRAAIDRLIAASLGHAAPATEAKIESWRSLSEPAPDKLAGQSASTDPEPS